MPTNAALDLIIQMKGDAEKQFAALHGEVKEVAKAAKEAGDAVERSGGLAQRAGGMLQQAFSFAAGGLLSEGIGSVFGALKGGLDSVISESSDAAEGQAALAAVLESTGGKAGVTADMANDLASNLQLVTKFTDDQVLSGENMLLTFTNIGSTVFPKATETVLNMAQAFGGDTSKAAVQLGKALNDPIAGISALSRVGVTFTAQQKDQIAAMVAAGDVAGAQGIILNELGTEFGGAARAAGNTFAGSMAILSHRLDDFKQSVGDAVLPMLARLGEFLNSAPVQSALSTAIAAVSAGLQNTITLVGQILDTVGPPLMAFFQLLAGFATGNLGQIAAAFTALPAPLQALGQLIGPLVANFSAFFQTVSSGGDILGALGTLVSTNFQVMLNWIMNTGLPLLGQTMVQMGTALWNWISPQILPALGKLAEWGGQLADWVLNTGVPLLWNKLLELGNKLWAWIEPQIGPASLQLSIWIKQLTDWIMNTGLPLLWTTVLDLGKKLVDWIGPMIPPALGQLAQWLGQLTGWIVTTGIPLLVGAVLGLAFRLVSWIADAIPKAQEAIRNFFSNLFASTKAQESGAHQSFLEMAGSMLQGLVDGITNLQDTVRTALTTMWNNMVAAFKSAAGINSPSTVFMALAGHLIDGLVQGLVNGWHLVMNKLHELAMQIPQPIRDALGIHSPAQETQDLGGYITAGLAQGIDQGKTTVMTSLGTLGTSMADWTHKVTTTIHDGLVPVGPTFDALFGTDGKTAGPDNILMKLFDHSDTAFFHVLDTKTNSTMDSYAVTWTNKLNIVNERVSDGLKALKDTAVQGALAVGQALVSGIEGPINNAVDGIARAAANAVRAAIEAARAAADANSPSRVMMERVGVPLAQGVLVPMQQAAASAANVGASLTNATVNGAATAGIPSVAGGGSNVTYIVNINGPSLGSQSFWNGFARQIAVAMGTLPNQQLRTQGLRS